MESLWLKRFLNLGIGMLITIPLFATEMVVGFTDAPQKIEVINGEVTGPVADVWDTIARRSNLSYRYQNLPPKRLKNKLESGEVQVALTQRQLEGMTSVQFLSEPLYIELFGVWHREETDPVESLQELIATNGALGVLRGANNIDQRLKSLEAPYKFESVTRPKQLFLMLDLNRIQYGYMAYFTGKELVKSQNLKDVVFSEMDAVGFHISVFTKSPKGKAIFQKLQKAHNDLISEGIVVELLF